MNIEDLTIKQARELAALFGGVTANQSPANPFIGKRVLIRTYSAGVHIGTLVSVNGMEAHLKDALRLWKWEGGGLSLSAVATNGIKGGRLNKTPEVFLTNVIEIIPTSSAAEETFIKYIEDVN
jgi:hypothetical protein